MLFLEFEIFYYLPTFVGVEFFLKILISLMNVVYQIYTGTLVNIDTNIYIYIMHGTMITQSSNFKDVRGQKLII